MTKKDFLWVGFLLSAYLLLWGPLVQVQPYLSSGDMGRDLYAFARTSQGHWPCQDFWWQYGPLMPLYYAFWFLTAGASILSARLGLGVILFLCSLTTYITLRQFVTPVVAFLASLAFLSFDMGHTFNHVGALPFLIFSIYCVWKFLCGGKTRWCYIATASLIGVALVKITAGVTSFAAFFASLIVFEVLARRHPGDCAKLPLRHFLFIPLFFCIAVYGAYALQYRGLDSEWIGQCMTMQSKTRVGFNTPLLYLRNLAKCYFLWKPLRLLWPGLVVVLGVLAGLVFRKKRVPAKEQRVFFAAALSLALFAGANATDYFVDGRIWRVDFWCFSELVLAAGLLAGPVWGWVGPYGKGFWGFLIFLAMLGTPWNNAKAAMALRVSERYLDSPRGRVYLGGALEDVATVREGAEFLRGNSRPGDLIFAAPYDPLYCFLAERPHAVREMLFIEQLPIPEEQQGRIIRALEEKNVPLVLISNRHLYRADDPGIGYFGETHCRTLAKYIFDAYEEVFRRGPWVYTPQLGHGIKIFRRKPEA